MPTICEHGTGSHIACEKCISAVKKMAARAGKTAKAKKTEADVRHLLTHVESIMKNSSSIRHIGVLVDSIEAWEGLKSAHHLMKAKGY